MRVLITGGSSLLGKALTETNPGHSIESTWYTNYIKTPMRQMDICNQSQIGYVFSQLRPQIVIHCAANASVEFAEMNYQESYRMNVDGTYNILRAAADYKAKVIYISTNAVYRGDNPPYTENGPFGSVNRYGAIKRLAEQAVEDYRHGWIIIRPFLLYGWHYPGGRTNWAVIIKDKLQRNKPLKLVNDKLWQPTYVSDCARAIWNLSEYRDEAFNLATDDKMTLYQFGLQVAKTWGLNGELLEPVASDYFPSIAPRPDNTSYDLSKIHNLGIKLLTVKGGLKEMKKNE